MRRHFPDTHMEEYAGQATFEDSHVVRVGEERLTAHKIFINVGARAYVPANGYDDVDYLTNVSMMDVDEVPEHLVIIGGSYVGLDPWPGILRRP